MPESAPLVYTALNMANSWAPFTLRRAPVRRPFYPDVLSGAPQCAVVFAPKKKQPHTGGSVRLFGGVGGWSEILSIWKQGPTIT